VDRIQHLRDHNIEPEEAEDRFFHDYDLASDDRRFEDVYILDGEWMVQILSNQVRTGGSALYSKRVPLFVCLLERI